MADTRSIGKRSLAYATTAAVINPSVTHNSRLGSIGAMSHLACPVGPGASRPGLGPALDEEDRGRGAGPRHHLSPSGSTGTARLSTMEMRRFSGSNGSAVTNGSVSALPVTPP